MFAIFNQTIRENNWLALCFFNVLGLWIIYTLICNVDLCVLVDNFLLQTCEPLHLLLVQRHYKGNFLDVIWSASCQEIRTWVCCFCTLIGNWLAVDSVFNLAHGFLYHGNWILLQWDQEMYKVGYMELVWRIQTNTYKVASTSRICSCIEKSHKQQEHAHNPILWNVENLHSKVAEDGRTAKHAHNPILRNLEILHCKVAGDGRTAKPIFLKEAYNLSLCNSNAHKHSTLNCRIQWPALGSVA